MSSPTSLTEPVTCGTSSRRSCTCWRFVLALFLTLPLPSYTPVSLCSPVYFPVSSCRRWTGICVRRRPSPGWSCTRRWTPRRTERTSWFLSSPRKRTSRSHRYVAHLRHHRTRRRLMWPAAAERLHADLWYVVCCSCWTCAWWTSARWTTATASSPPPPSVTSPRSTSFIKFQVSLFFWPAPPETSWTFSVPPAIKCRTAWTHSSDPFVCFRPDVGERGPVCSVDDSLHGYAAIRSQTSTQGLPQSQIWRQAQHPDTRGVSGPAGEQNQHTYSLYNPPVITEQHFYRPEQKSKLVV